MKKISLILLFTTALFYPTLSGQKSSDFSKIDIMLVHGEYKKVIDTCRQILLTDSLNSEIYYKMGLAYQNFLPDDKSFDCFFRAAALSPDNNLYKYMVAKGFYNKNKYSHARPLLQNLCTTDSTNWSYAYYLTSIYLQEGKYDESIKIYNRFYKKDSTNYVYLDKLGFAYLKMGDQNNAIGFFNKSLALNNKNINAIKNVSYLYAITYKIDTAIQLLTRGIEIDSSDMDLYVRRAAFNFSKNYTKRALDDYLKIIASGDSSVLYLKRCGIGYTNNLQPREAIDYLLLARKKDTTDYEIMDYLARNYHKINDFKKSAYYYKEITKILLPVSYRLGFTYIVLAEELKSDGQYKEAITNYLKSQDIRHDVSITMIIANLYDEKLHDNSKAIYYYKLFLDNEQNTRSRYRPDYIESVKKRLQVLQEKQQPQAKKTEKDK
jgi:tetratricopeptide (TPR) repeat protein